MLTILAWFLPHDVWSWLGYIAAAVIIAFLWIVPATLLRLTERIAGTLIVVAIVTLVAQWGALSRAEGKVSDLTDQVQAAQAEATAADARSRLLEQAAIERALDDKDVADLKKDLTDAIQSAPESKPDAAGVQLACARLRAAGKTTGADYRALCS